MWTAWRCCTARTSPALVETRRALRQARIRFRRGFSGSAEIRAWRLPPPARPAFRLPSIAGSRAAAALFYSHKTISRAAHVVDRNLESGRRVPATASMQPAKRHFPSPRDVPRATCRLATSCSPLRWRDGYPNSGRWNITGRSRRGCATNSGIPLVLDGPPGADFARGRGRDAAPFEPGRIDRRDTAGRGCCRGG